MDLSPCSIRAQLVVVDAHGWDSWAGRALLEQVRSGIVEPVVRRSGLTGAAADQAGGSGWAAAWDALRRPSVRCAENPAGLVWVAVRRAVWAEVLQGRSGPDRDLVGPMGGATPDVTLPDGASAGQLGPNLVPIVDALVEMGWQRADLVDAIEELAAHATHTDSGQAQVRWRWAALRVGLPEWQARRLASALLGAPGHPGVLAMVATGGPGVLQDPGIRRVLRATCQRSLASPSAHLTSWAEPARASGESAPGPLAPASQARPESSRVDGDTRWKLFA